MNTKFVAIAAFATLAFGATTAALAQEATFEPVPAVTSSVTRPQVQADLAKARADGSIAYSRAGYLEPLRVSKAREAVQAETRAAIRSGEVEAINAEVYGHSVPRALVLARAGR
jgi:hypothetical protein